MNKKTQQVILLALLSVMGFSSVANAVPWKFVNPVASKVSVRPKATNKFFKVNFVPPKTGRLTYSVGGAVRDRNLCAADAENAGQIVALVADNALTAQSHPTFMAMVPELNSDKSATLIVKNESESYYETASFTVPAAGGKVAMTLPDSAPALEIGEDYSWFMQIQCGSAFRVEDPIVEGLISRVALDVPVFSSMEESAQFFAEQGIWYDSLAAADLLSADGDSRYWDVLLSSVNIKP